MPPQSPLGVSRVDAQRRSGLSSSSLLSGATRGCLCTTFLLRRMGRRGIVRENFLRVDKYTIKNPSTESRKPRSPCLFACSRFSQTVQFATFFFSSRSL